MITTNNYKIPNFEGRKLEDIPLEEAIEFVTRIAEAKGHRRIFSHYKFREIITADKLLHRVHEKVSNAEGRGSDATESCGKQAEYKTKADDGNCLYETYKFSDRTKKCKSAKVTMNYNGAYSEEIARSYEKHNHYACLFDENERITLIIKVDTSFIVETLIKRNRERKTGKSTNFNSVHVDLIKDSSLFEVIYDFLED
jgi:hypothetical protein